MALRKWGVLTKFIDAVADVINRAFDSILSKEKEQLKACLLCKHCRGTSFRECDADPVACFGVSKDIREWGWNLFEPREGDKDGK